jgi:uncharacterized protein
MKIVIDTNVLVSAILKDRDPEDIILYIAAQPDFEWTVSSEILTEYKDVLQRDKFGLPADVLQTWFSLLDSLTSIIDPDVVPDFPRDQKDAKFLACAFSSGADYFITGDRDFEQPLKIGNTTVLSVRQFKKLIMRAEDLPLL